MALSAESLREQIKQLEERMASATPEESTFDIQLQIAALKFELSVEEIAEMNEQLNIEASRAAERASGTQPLSQSLHFGDLPKIGSDAKELTREKGWLTYEEYARKRDARNAGVPVSEEEKRGQQEEAHKVQEWKKAEKGASDVKVSEKQKLFKQQAKNGMEIDGVVSDKTMAYIDKNSKVDHVESKKEVKVAGKRIGAMVVEVSDLMTKVTETDEAGNKTINEFTERNREQKLIERENAFLKVIESKIESIAADKERAKSSKSHDFDPSSMGGLSPISSSALVANVNSPRR